MVFVSHAQLSHFLIVFSPFYRFRRAWECYGLDAIRMSATTSCEFIDHLPLRCRVLILHLRLVNASIAPKATTWITTLNRSLMIYEYTMRRQSTPAVVFSRNYGVHVMLDRNWPFSLVSCLFVLRRKRCHRKNIRFRVELEKKKKKRNVLANFGIDRQIECIEQSWTYDQSLISLYEYKIGMCLQPFS